MAPTANSIRFLGTAGGRWVVAKQIRASGGIYLQLEGKRILMDPGPGSLVRCAQTEPPIEVAELDAVLLTHAHIDHCNDVNIIIDAMTAGGIFRRGTLFAPRQCIEGDNAVVYNYVRRFLHDIVPIEPSGTYALGNLHFKTSI
ncbi:MAG: MBL fold metallo-hydrolase, partial [Candidatus Hydrogenedentes bacterium]|nr:MBL fold metallo-hydrolase [Candidatus Hydrogenedentota bacterium]